MLGNKCWTKKKIVMIIMRDKQKVEETRALS